MGAIAACTIIAKNYLPYARTLEQSFHKFHPEVPLHVLLCDRIDNYFDPTSESFQLTTLDQLEIPQINDMCFKYNVLELSTAVKPFWLQYLANQFRYERILYLDPDIVVYKNLNHIFDLLKQHNAVIIPHLRKEPSDPKDLSEIKYLQCGCFNLGFIGLSINETTRSFLAWWQNKLRYAGFSKPHAGMFVDQKWIDLAVGYYDGFYILRDPGYNLAYWNIAQCEITQDSQGELKVNGGPLYFYHFSGYNSDNPNQISKYDTSLKLSQFPALHSLFQGYRDRLSSNGISKCRQYPYAYGTFDNGDKITTDMRWYYTAITTSGRKSYSNPFDTKESQSFYKRYRSIIRRIAGSISFFKNYLQRRLSNTYLKIISSK